MSFMEQDYYSEQEDTSSRIIQDVFDMLPSSTNSVVDWKKEGENAEEMNNILLTKESEIAALKEVIAKWKNRALQAESNAYYHYLDELDSVREQHGNEIIALESRYIRKLNDKDEIITNLKEQVDYLIVQNSRHLNIDNDDEESCNEEYDYDEEYDTESYISSMEEDSSSVTSSVYDRELEQGLNTMNHDGQTVNRKVMKSETILNNIQNTMRAIELKLSGQSEQDFSSRPEREAIASGSENAFPSTGNAETSLSPSRDNDTTRNGKQKAFSINRIFKKALPQLKKGQSSYHRSSKHYSIDKIESWCEDNSFVLQ